MKWRRALQLALFTFVAACVPTEPEKDIRGGIAVTFAPSEATAGAPFQTNDGWTVTIEKTALRAQAYAQPRAVESYGASGTSYPRLVDPRFVCELRVTQLFPGPTSVSVDLQPQDPRYQDDLDESDVCAVDAATVRRFKTYSDDSLVTPEILSDDYGYGFVQAPTAYVKGVAVKSGRSLAFDLALAVIVTPGSSGTYDENGIFHPSDMDPETGVTVLPNQGTPARFEVHFESMFAGGIDPLAAADADGDGKITADELRVVPLACETTSPGIGSSSGYPGDDDYGNDDDDYANDDDYDDDDDDVDRSPRCPTLLSQLLMQSSAILGRAPTKR